MNSDKLSLPVLLPPLLPWTHEPKQRDRIQQSPFQLSRSLVFETAVEISCKSASTLANGLVVRKWNQEERRGALA